MYIHRKRYAHGHLIFFLRGRQGFLPKKFEWIGSGWF